MVKAGVVGLDVHVFILGEVADAEAMQSDFEGERYPVAHPEVIPVVSTTLRHHERAGLVAVERQCTHRRLVLGIDRAVAGGVTHREGVDTSLEDIHLHLDGSGGLVYIHQLGTGEFEDYRGYCKTEGR